MATQPQRSFIGIGIAIGIAIGAGIGVALGNIAIGIPIGLALGIAYGAIMDGRDRARRRAEGGDGTSSNVGYRGRSRDAGNDGGD